MSSFKDKSSWWKKIIRFAVFSQLHIYNLHISHILQSSSSSQWENDMRNNFNTKFVSDLLIMTMKTKIHESFDLPAKITNFALFIHRTNLQMNSAILILSLFSLLCAVLCFYVSLSRCFFISLPCQSRYTEKCVVLCVVDEWNSLKRRKIKVEEAVSTHRVFSPRLVSTFENEKMKKSEFYYFALSWTWVVRFRTDF